ncbi:nuclear transport factor 2 family protein [Pseudoxanthomonas sp. PXM01]|uniref:nuclear transport factor 2 family protein n=1 Tax=Pseudoxanthomonas sp. PXM01 TaxID=2769295 RepID=UPI0017866F3A|nr:nuclear transport factor 2 family protein [Pseudoxanthomonas sp. PXM01]MBD9468196.1 nuclear transport factor 2 family protein [Pseudoxanthomonas sp. PXM01]
MTTARWRRARTAFCGLLGTALLCGAVEATAAAERTPEQLTEAIAALDTAVFDTFNTCADPAQLTKHAAYFDEAVEFYHDNGGVTWTRDDMIARTREYVCGRYRRELVPGTLEVFPIKGFGAISQGTHRFCALPEKDCAGEADFVMVWRERDSQWQVTRVLSYAHRPAAHAP